MAIKSGCRIHFSFLYNVCCELRTFCIKRFVENMICRSLQSFYIYINKLTEIWEGWEKLIFVTNSNQSILQSLHFLQHGANIDKPGFCESLTYASIIQSKREHKPSLRTPRLPYYSIGRKSMAFLTFISWRNSESAFVDKLRKQIKEYAVFTISVKELGLTGLLVQPGPLDLPTRWWKTESYG